MDQGRSTADEALLARLDALERRTQALESLVAEKDAIIAAQRAQIETLQAALDRAQEQLALLKKAFFGPRRERYVPSPDQKLLFEAEPLTAAPSESTTTPELPQNRPDSRVASS